MPLLRPVEKPAPTHYDVDGVKLPRVSAIVGILDKPGLATWRGRVGNDEADRVSRTARDFGTRLHAAVERCNLDESPSIGRLEFDDDLKPFIEAYCEWGEANVRRVVACERRVVSRQHGYAGTTDCVVELLDGDLGVLDYKTGLGLAEEGIVCPRRLILTFAKDAPGRLRVHDLDRHREDTAAFLALLEVYRWLNP
jgi:hypothetical protein